MSIFLFHLLCHLLWPLPVGRPTCWFLTVPSVLSSPTRSWSGSFWGWLICLTVWHSSVLARFHWEVTYIHGLWCPGSCPLESLTPDAAFAVCQTWKFGAVCRNLPPVSGLNFPVSCLLHLLRNRVCSQWNFLPCVTVYNPLCQGSGRDTNLKPRDS